MNKFVRCIGWTVLFLHYLWLSAIVVMIYGEAWKQLTAVTGVVIVLCLVFVNRRAQEGHRFACCFCLAAATLWSLFNKEIQSAWQLSMTGDLSDMLWLYQTFAAYFWPVFLGFTLERWPRIQRVKPEAVSPTTEGS